MVRITRSTYLLPNRRPNAMAVAWSEPGEGVKPLKQPVAGVTVQTTSWATRFRPGAFDSAPRRSTWSPPQRRRSLVHSESSASLRHSVGCAKLTSRRVTIRTDCTASAGAPESRSSHKTLHVARFIEESRSAHEHVVPQAPPGSTRHCRLCRPHARRSLGRAGCDLRDVIASVRGRGVA